MYFQAQKPPSQDVLGAIKTTIDISQKALYISERAFFVLITLPDS